MHAKKTYGTIVQLKGSHLIVEELRDELVIFDRRTNKAHMLDARAAAIYRAAKDGCTVESLVDAMDDGTVSEKTAAVQLAVTDLERAGLVTSDMPAIPRRSLLKTLGTAAAMPLVVSILAPTPAAAATQVSGGTSCVGGDTCADPNRVCTNTGSTGGGPPAKCCVSTNYPNQTNWAHGAGEPCDGNEDCCSNVCMPSTAYTATAPVSPNPCSGPTPAAGCTGACSGN